MIYKTLKGANCRKKNNSFVNQCTPKRAKLATHYLKITKIWQPRIEVAIFLDIKVKTISSPLQLPLDA